MFQQIKKLLKRRKKNTKPIDPDEIFLDSQNLPDFDKHQFEGRIEKPISRSVFRVVTFFIVIVGTLFTYKLWNLQIREGNVFRKRSDNNSLHDNNIFAPRGVIYDR